MITVFLLPLLIFVIGMVVGFVLMMTGTAGWAFRMWRQHRWDEKHQDQEIPGPATDRRRSGKMGIDETMAAPDGGAGAGPL